jgi:hypothetical protein
LLFFSISCALPVRSAAAHPSLALVPASPPHCPPRTASPRSPILISRARLVRIFSHTLRPSSYTHFFGKCFFLSAARRRSTGGVHARCARECGRRVAARCALNARSQIAFYAGRLGMRCHGIRRPWELPLRDFSQGGFPHPPANTHPQRIRLPWYARVWRIPHPRYAHSRRILSPR